MIFGNKKALLYFLDRIKNLSKEELSELADYMLEVTKHFQEPLSIEDLEQIFRDYANR